MGYRAGSMTSVGLAFAVVAGALVVAGGSSTAVVTPTTRPPVVVVPPGGIITLPTTPPPTRPRPTTTPTSQDRPTTTIAPDTVVPSSAAPPPTAVADQQGPPPDQQSQPDPPQLQDACAVAAADDHYATAADADLLVTQPAGLGANDTFGCLGGYEIGGFSTPAHGVLANSINLDGAFKYTPDPGFTGTDSFTYTLTHLASQVTASATAHITVTDGCAAVAFPDEFSTWLDEPLAVGLPGLAGNDTLPACDDWSVTVLSPPLNGTVNVDPGGTFAYTPDAGFSGVDTFTYGLLGADQTLLASAPATIYVLPRACAPVDDSVTTPADTPLVVAAPGVLGNDVMYEPDQVAELAIPPFHGDVTLAPDGSFEYVPDAGFSGQDSFVYNCKPDGLFAKQQLATVTIDVTAASEPPATTEPPSGTDPSGPTPTTSPTTQSTTVPTTQPVAVPSPLPPPPDGLRVATFDASLTRGGDGELADDLAGFGDPQAAAAAEILQRTRPDVVLLNQFDDAAESAAVDLFRSNYLLRSQRGAEPIDYPYVFAAPVNSGLASGFDLDNDGTVGGPNDAFGAGQFAGQGAMVVLSRYPIATEDVRTFQHLPWASLPGARLPDDPATPEPADWYSPEELAVLPLSSTSHWDVPIDVDGRTVHVLASNPTPPGSDGSEDRNGLRNADEIGFWADYVAGVETGWIVDDAGTSGGLAAGAEFVVVGALNSDPFDGDSLPGAIDQLLALPSVADPEPASEGAIEAAGDQAQANLAHIGDPRLDTADLADDPAAGGPGNLRSDYVLPSSGFAVAASGVFWPSPSFSSADLVGGDPPASSAHRLVWVDLV